MGRAAARHRGFPRADGGDGPPPEHRRLWPGARPRGRHAPLPLDRGLEPPRPGDPRPAAFRGQHLLSRPPHPGLLREPRRVLAAGGARPRAGRRPRPVAERGLARRARPLWPRGLRPRPAARPGVGGVPPGRARLRLRSPPPHAPGPASPLWRCSGSPSASPSSTAYLATGARSGAPPAASASSSRPSPAATARSSCPGPSPSSWRTGGRPAPVSVPRGRGPSSSPCS